MPPRAVHFEVEPSDRARKGKSSEIQTVSDHICVRLRIMGEYSVHIWINRSDMRVHAAEAVHVCPRANRNPRCDSIRGCIGIHALELVRRKRSD